MGDFNIYTKDIDSVVTGFGRHQRVCAFLPQCEPEFNGDLMLYCRVDRVNGLPDPTTQEILAVARKDQGVKGKFKLVQKTVYGKDDVNIDCWFTATK